MKTESEVREKFEEMRNRKIDEFAETRLRKCYSNCAYNHLVKVKNIGKIGFCRNPTLLEEQEGAPLVCNDDVVCGRCGYYVNENSPESICKEFMEILRSPSRCGEEYPKLAILIWFLQDTRGESSRFRRLLNHLKKATSEIVKVLTLRWV